MKTQKAIIFDSGTLISFTSAGLIPELRRLKEIFKGKFIITHEVKEEVVTKPLRIKRFSFSAYKIKQLLDDKVLEMPESLGVKQQEMYREIQNFLDVANNTFFERKKPIKIIDTGEASCLSLSRILDRKKIQNVISVDERTTRVLGEKPENLRQILQKKLHTKITSKQENYKTFSGFKFIRSAELIYVAYKKNLARIKDGKDVLDAMLYALKFSGCAISGKEIEEMKKIN